MATETVAVTINTTTYTALSSGQESVEVFVRRGQSVRLHVATTAPSDSTTAYELIHGPSSAGGDLGVAKQFCGLAADEEVYCRLDNVGFRTGDFASTTSDVVVIRGNSCGGSGSSAALGEHLSGTTTATHGSVQSLGQVTRSTMVFEMDITSTKTATVELYGRNTTSLGWVLFDTVSLTDVNYLKAYDSAPYVGWKVTAITAATTVNISVAF